MKPLFLDYKKIYIITFFFKSQEKAKKTDKFQTIVVDRNEGFLNRRIVNEGNVDNAGFSCYIAVTLYNFTYT